MFDPKLKEALGRVQKPGRYTGGEPGSVYKDKEKVDVRFAFCFPDTYEVGMSFLGEKILYELLNSHENWWCERAFMPWLDMKAEMERLGLPLYTMESKDPLTAFDAVGFTLQYELSYTNILAMLDLAHIPFYAKDRDEHWPLIVAGGPCACNSEPIADFFDVIQLGEGENQLPSICAEIERAKKEGGVSKKELLRIACGVSLCTAVMWVVFAALHLVGWVVFDYRVLLGGIIGVAGGVIGSLFHIGVNYATAIRGAHPWILYLLPVGGLAIVGLYKLCHLEGKGTNAIIESVHFGESVPILLVPVIFVSTVITHLCGGSAGREGAALQMGGTIGQCMGRTFRLDDRDLRVATLAGMAAFFSALFGTPLAATVFAIMVISIGVIYHVALYPSLLAALVAYGFETGLLCRR